ncbi:MAG TPA: hypothetical protein VLD35_11100, partial [Caldimonas sp.]|nr:hypothetical protein [Caldimonas sp.]
MRPEGELRVGLRVERGRIARVDIASSRPDIAGAMLQGRQREEVQAALPLLFSVCGRSQSVAGALAWAVAAGEPIGPETLDRCARAVSAEMIRESACRVLLEWPRWLGETADGAAIAAARGVVAGGSDAGAGARHQAVARACFEAGGATWIGQRTLREFDRWLDAGSTVA